ncbi:HWE histidine kinase domain-containing protein [Afifella sp. IM 167]|uniref:HWE histidine kinase domain-containing protein n=1 Tax=Afifella sp. IM 167 TaxID=2033586 RepID=UPI001CCA5D4C|nr:HWE histidine kinase domain-containing protein [Afifella sp. IM 167]MBZ8133134.1 two-component system sensor histidine kinase/response regulator [Afifella sp. IM 167]
MSGPTVDLTNCDREPIHQLGAIQPFGFLLAASADWNVARASANLADFLGLSPEEAIGRPVVELIGEKALHAIRNGLTVMRGTDAVERLLALPLGPAEKAFDVAVHMVDGQIVIEGEPSDAGAASSAASTVRSMMSRLEQASGLDGLLREGARQVRALTGFDRVMVYRFDEEGAGEVMAEAVRPGIGSFLGLHYPASDIPAQARILYLRNLFRIIADVNAEPVPVVPALDAKGRPLDLSMSILRAVSSIHIEYLKNMGVAASLSISIVVEGRLWGLFACHHYKPLLPSFERRSVAELFAQLFASRLESRERRLAGEFEIEGRRVADRIVASVADDASLLENPEWLAESISQTIPCDGIGVWLEGEYALAGIAPDREEFEAIVGRLNAAASGEVFSTDSLSALLGREVAGGRVAGLLAIPVSRLPRDYVVLFRQEFVQSVEWAGDPTKPVEAGPNGDRLTPRKSFEKWSELVRGRSRPFTSAERRVGEAIRIALIETVLRLTEEANRFRQQANERQELLIAELNHRVRNILSLIRGLVRQTRVSSRTIESYVGQLDSRLQALAMAHDQITRDHWAPAPLRALLEAEAAAYLGPKADRVTVSGREALLTPEAFSTVALVFHELLTNSAKYGSLSDNGAIDIAWDRRKDGSLNIAWREHGGPAVKAPTRQGFGTTIINRSIPFDLKGEAEVVFELSGLKANFVIPSRYVSFAEGEAPEPASLEARPAAARANGAILLERNVLLVEDSLIIALDAESILADLGAPSVHVCTGIAEARQVIAAHQIDMALLDVNLGDQTSFPLADELAAAGVPFLFATGYGEDTDLPEEHRGRLVLQKPYTAQSMAKKFAELLSEGG